MKYEFLIAADADLPTRKALSILNSRRCMNDYEELAGSVEGFCHVDNEAAEEIVEWGARVYHLHCEAESHMGLDDVCEALEYALMQGGGLNPDVRIVSIG